MLTFEMVREAKQNWPKSKLAEVEIGRSRNWPNSKKKICRSRNWPKLTTTLQYSLYGTRDAAPNWEEELASTLRDLMLMKGIACPHVWHGCIKGECIVATVHGTTSQSVENESQRLHRLPHHAPAPVQMESSQTGMPRVRKRRPRTGRVICPHTSLSASTSLTSLAPASCAAPKPSAVASSEPQARTNANASVSVLLSSLLRVPLPRSPRPVLLRQEIRPYRGDFWLFPVPVTLALRAGPMPSLVTRHNDLMPDLILLFLALAVFGLPRVVIGALITNESCQHLCLVVHHAYGLRQSRSGVASET